jgi:hypothetical protein
MLVTASLLLSVMHNGCVSVYCLEVGIQIELPWMIVLSANIALACKYESHYVLCWWSEVHVIK